MCIKAIKDLVLAENPMAAGPRYPYVHTSYAALGSWNSSSGEVTSFS